MAKLTSAEWSILGWDERWPDWSPGVTMRVFACCHNRSIEHLFLAITELIGLNPLLTSPCASICNHPTVFGRIVKLDSQSFGTRTLLRQKISDIGETHPNNEWLISPEPDYNQPSSTERSRTEAISLKLLLKYLRHSRGQTQPRLMEAFLHGTWSNYFFSRLKKCPHYYSKTKLYVGQFRERTYLMPWKYSLNANYFAPTQISYLLSLCPGGRYTQLERQ